MSSARIPSIPVVYADSTTQPELTAAQNSLGEGGFYCLPPIGLSKNSSPSVLSHRPLQLIFAVPFDCHPFPQLAQHPLHKMALPESILSSRIVFFSHSTALLFKAAHAFSRRDTRVKLFIHIYMDMALHVSLPVVCTPLYPFRFRSSGSYSVSNSVSHLSLIFGHKILHFRLATPDFIWVCPPLDSDQPPSSCQRRLFFPNIAQAFQTRRRYRQSLLSNNVQTPSVSPCRFPPLWSRKAFATSETQN